MTSWATTCEETFAEKTTEAFSEKEKYAAQLASRQVDSLRLADEALVPSGESLATCAFLPKERFETTRKSNIVGSDLCASETRIAGTLQVDPP